MTAADMETCTAEFQRLASKVGGIDCAGSPIVTMKQACIDGEVGLA